MRTLLNSPHAMPVGYFKFRSIQFFFNVGEPVIPWLDYDGTNTYFALRETRILGRYRLNAGLTATVFRKVLYF